MRQLFTGGVVIHQVEILRLDLRYESYRLKSLEAERRLLNSIIEHGIKDPLQGVDDKGSLILLNGFKRVRCCRKLKLKMVPYQSLGNDEILGIIELLRISNARSLNILEQSKLIDELKTVFKMSHSEIATLLEKSKTWVSVRCGIVKEMGEFVMTKIFNDEFPVYSYMYTLRPFRRQNGIKPQEIDEFVSNVSGKRLSTRDIDILARGYFNGSNAFREQIKNGNVLWGLNQLKQTSVDTTNCTEIERSMLRDLEIISKYLRKVSVKCTDKRYKTSSFFAQAHLLGEGIIRQLDGFGSTIRGFYDRCGQT
jgi:hypothetical protein